MTPRLKKLLIGFAISLVILVSDRLSESSSSRSDRTDRKNEEGARKRPRTARVDAERMRRLSEDVEWFKKQKETKIVKPSQEFIPIPEKVLTLSDWGRNPFSSSGRASVSQVKQSVQPTSMVVPEQKKISSLISLKIESVATLGDKTFVIINGQRFQEGDTIDDMLIETIKSKSITFKVGSKIIVKNVGT